MVLSGSQIINIGNCQDTETLFLECDPDIATILLYFWNLFENILWLFWYYNKLYYFKVFIFQFLLQPYKNTDEIS